MKKKWALNSVKPYQEIFKLFSKQLKSLGFDKLRSAWWERKQNLLLQKIHIHKFSFTTSFRVHAAIHLNGFEKDSVWLNGTSSHDGWFEKQVVGLPVGRYVFDYSDSPSSLQKSADSLFEFTKDILLPWFEKWSDIEKLRSSPDSPLSTDQKAFLAQAEPTIKISEPK